MNLFKLVKYQLQIHSKTYHKYKNQLCRFSLGKYFTSRTIVAKPLRKNVPENDKILLLQKQGDKSDIYKSQRLHKQLSKSFQSKLFSCVLR